MLAEVKLCECGCGKPVKTAGCRFTPGHNGTGQHRKGEWRSCGYCGAPIWVQMSRSKNGAGQYCNRACKGAASKGKHLKEQNPNWRGGRVVIAGRPAICKPDHPRAHPNGYVYEHVLMGERALGRPLKYYGPSDPRNEIVHHVNEIKADNRNKNFVICTEKYHKGLHMRLRHQERRNAIARS